MKKRPVHHTVVCLPNPPHVDGPVTVHLPAKLEFFSRNFQKTCPSTCKPNGNIEFIEIEHLLRRLSIS